MTRLHRDIQTTLSSSQISELVGNYLMSQGFEQQPYKGDFIDYMNQGVGGFTIRKKDTGEIVWTKGKGAFVSPQFFKISAKDGLAHVEAWGLSITATRGLFVPRVGEGVLEVPGLNMRLERIENILQTTTYESLEKRIQEFKEKRIKPWFLPIFIWKFWPYTWQGWTGFALIAFFLAAVFIKSPFRGMLMLSLGSLFIAVFTGIRFIRK